MVRGSTGYYGYGPPLLRKGGLSVPIRTRINFDLLVSDCVGILQGVKAPFYQGTGRGRPAPFVLVVPSNLEGWPCGFWNTLVGPILKELSLGPVTWGDPRSIGVVSARLRSAIAADPYWSQKVDY